MVRSIREPARDIPQAADVDVAVIGGGTAGVMAAVGAGRAGASTCLIERCATLGGALSNGLVGHFYNRFRDDAGRDIVRGAPRELLERLVANGGTPYCHIDEALQHVRIFFRHEYCAEACAEMIREAGVEPWLLTRFCRVLPNAGGGHTLILENKSGRLAVRARQVVDASGEADAAASAGATIIEETSRSWGLIFAMENVNAAQQRTFLDGCSPECPEFAPWLADRLGITVEALRGDSYWGEWLDGRFRAWPYRSQIMKAVDAGDLRLIVDIPSGGQIRYGWDGFWLEPWYGDDKAFANVCLLTGLDAACGRDISKAETAARAYAFDFLGFLRKYIPGFKLAVISMMGAQTMPRGGRVIRGEATITDADFFDGVIHSDAICLGVSRPDAPGSKVHGLPLGMFIPEGVSDMLVAGKCASGGYAVRGTVYCMSAGYSCGIVAAAAAAMKVSPADIVLNDMRRTLLEHGVVLEPEPSASEIVPFIETDMAGIPRREAEPVAEIGEQLS